MGAIHLVVAYVVFIHCEVCINVLFVAYEVVVFLELVWCTCQWKTNLDC